MQIFPDITDSVIEAAAESLRSGELVVIPTETVYGLGAAATDDSAVGKIFQCKGRPSDNPLIVHVDCFDRIRPYISEEIHPFAITLGDRFWPGPLTIVLPLRGGIAPSVSAGLDTIGVRVPDHPVALRLLRACQLPVAAPSANRSGSPSPTTALHVAKDLDCAPVKPRIILDGGSCRVGLESTVIQIVDNRVHILRPGAVTESEIAFALSLSPASVVNAYSTQPVDDQPRAPGMKYRHYAPTAQVIPVTNSQWSGLDKDTVLILFDSTVVEHSRRLSFGRNPSDLETASNRLFDLFRKADEIGVSRILIDCSFERETGLGAALWNRISKAAHR